MTDADKKQMLTVITGESDDTVLSTYLSIAGDKVCRRAFPYHPTIQTVPAQYEYTQVEIAAYLLNKRGAEGETAHGENGISRTYEDGDIPASLMRQIVPFAAVPKIDDPEELLPDEFYIIGKG